MVALGATGMRPGSVLSSLEIMDIAWFACADRANGRQVMSVADVTWRPAGECLSLAQKANGSTRTTHARLRKRTGRWMI